MQTGGNLVAVVRGVDGPKLETTIKRELKNETMVLKGETERVVVSGLKWSAQSASVDVFM